MSITPPTHTAINAGKRVKVATEAAAKAPSDKIRKQYAKALNNLKNR